MALESLRPVQGASGLPPTHAAGHPPQFVMPPTTGATGTTTDFGLFSKLNAVNVVAPFRDVAVAINGAVGFGGDGGGIFLPDDPVSG